MGVADSYVALMEDALEVARAAGAAGEVPIGALVVDASGEVLARAGNATIMEQDPTAHAEIRALRAAARHIGNHRLSGCTLVSTIEPCTMCAGALIHARIEHLVFAADEPKAGAVKSTACVLDNPHLNHRVSVHGGVLEEAAKQIIQGFFAARRKETSA